MYCSSIVDYFDLFSPTWRTAVGADFCPLKLSWHRESRWNREVDVCDDAVHPFPPQVSDRRLPSTDAAPESPEAGWCDRLSRPTDSWISRLFLRSLRPPRSPLNSSPAPSYVNIFNLAVCMNLIWKYLTNLFAALPASHRETAALYLSVSAHTPNLPTAYLWRGREGWRGKNNPVLKMKWISQTDQNRIPVRQKSRLTNICKNPPAKMYLDIY